MRKLRKLDLAELAKVMLVIPESELSSIVGAYDNDCFWRCVAYYLNNGIASESAAGQYALNYFSGSGCDHACLSANGAGMDFQDARAYVQANLPRARILYLNPDNISWYRNNGYSSLGGNSHAVIYQCATPDGQHQVYDPANDVTFTINAYEASTANGTYKTWS
ncbi:MAG: hypothetical protein LBH19_01430 [Dysgonamonadaceae bacterium]|jgi:hypothetical protein|nr:hypothetical protein [Dysgonamonadaceae bacterium]